MRPSRSVLPVAHMETMCGCAVIPTIPLTASINIVKAPIPVSALYRLKKIVGRQSAPGVLPVRNREGAGA